MSRRGASACGAADEPTHAGTQRVDKWLWFVRVVKTRTQAAALVTGGKVRINRARVDKPGAQVRLGDVVTVATGPRVRVLKVLQAGERRGSPAQAQLLYEEIPPAIPDPARPSRAEVGGDSSPAAGRREAGTGRPTKRDRRLLDRLRSG